MFIRNTILSFIILFNILNFCEDNGYLFKRLSIEDGLSQSTIMAILQDKEGYIWIGTGNGLNKYDGYKFTIYTNDPYDSTSISDNGITSMFEDKNGSLWVGTQTGILNKYNRNNDSFKQYYLDIPNDPEFELKEKYYDYPIVFSRNDNKAITSIADDNKGNLWIGTWGNGICKFDKKSGKIKNFRANLKNKSGLSYNRIKEILIDKKGIIWIGTFGGGLNKIIKKNGSVSDIIFEKYTADPANPNSLNDDKICSLYMDKKGNLWIGTYHGGLNLLSSNQFNVNAQQAKFVHYKNKADNPNSLSNNSVMSITEDKNGCIWIGTFGGGLNRFDKTKNSFLNFKNDPLNENSLAGNDVLSLFVDNSGILWAGTHLGDGITKLQMNEAKFGHIKNNPANNNSLSDNVIWSIYQDKAGFLWFGTYRGGLNKYDRKRNKFTVYKNNPNDPYSLSSNHIRSIAQDNFNNFWIGTYDGGLNKFNTKTKKFIRYKHNPNDSNSIGANQIQDIYVDKNSNVWLATFGGGLNKFSASNNSGQIKFEKYIHNPSDPKSLSDDRVYSIYEDREGFFWIGTFGGGLNKFDRKTGSFISYKNVPNNINSLSDNRVLDVYEDKYGNIWIGTYGGGLNKFNPKTEKFIRYKKKNGLNCDVVYGILEDDNNNLWISSDNGIYKFNYLTENVTHYDLQDGIQSLEFSGGAFLKTKDGEMFFGGVNGLNYFYPDSVKNSSYLPNIVITSVKVSNKFIKGERKKLTLKHDQNFISFEFASLDYTNPADNVYQYKLAGLETQWQKTGANIRMANYTNLSPGNYKFLVKGSNSDGVWNEKTASIDIEILPPFWQTWWFISLSLLFALLIIYYLSTLRIKNLLAIERLKTKLAADLHDNIGSGLTEISILSELAEKDFEKISNNSHSELKKISEKSRALVDNMSDIVWVVNPKRDSLHDLILRLKDSYSDFLSSINISLKTSNLDELDNIKLPMEYKQNLFLIFKEGINNCIKHSKCKHIYLNANINGNVLEMILEDDGVGLNGKNTKQGNGIKNMKTRAELIGGRIQWDSFNSKGTKIYFTAKMGVKNKFRFFLSKKII